MTYSKYNGINLDLGHFTAANNTSPIPFLQKHADRITHVHVKDRKMNNGPNVPFGQGDTPIKRSAAAHEEREVQIPGDHRVRVSVPEGSTR